MIEAIIPLCLLLWLLGLWLIYPAATAAIGGWSRLSVLYRAQVVFSGERMRVQGAQMGNVPYKWVKIGADSRGIHLSMPAFFVFRHPSLFVPWEHLRLREGTFPMTMWSWGGSHQLEIEFLKAQGVRLRISGASVVDTLLSRAASAHPASLAKDAETQRAVAELAATPPRKVSRFAWVPVVIIAGLYVLSAWMDSPERRRHKTFDNVQAEASRILAETTPPAGAVRIGAPQLTRAEQSGSAWMLGHVFLRQQYSRPGIFADTRAWYDARLTGRGWMRDTEAARETTYCRGAWSLDIYNTESWGVEDHKFSVSVSWWASGLPCPSKPQRLTSDNAR